ncbi:MAG: hypothetical protein AAFN81_25460 [Bacteroidota bacterium]
MNLNDKKFWTAANAVGVSSSETLFHYHQQGQTITGTYSGGKIQEGYLLGKQVSEDQIEMLYQCLTVEGQLLAGESKGRLSKNAEGLLEIRYAWNWLNGDQSGGHSHYIEIQGD